MNLAPIVLFVYNRPWHTLQTLEALKANAYASKSVLYIYADGPKANASAADKATINETRRVLKSKQWCKDVHIIAHDTNKGLALNIVEGVTQIVEKHGKIIVLEDDIITSPQFLAYMNAALNYYEKEEKVMHISGYMQPIGGITQPFFFYNQTSCWGWATWKRAWHFYQPEARVLYRDILKTKRDREFNLENSYPFLQHLKNNIDGTWNTWAIKWHASVFLLKGLCLHPNRSYTQNIGMDGSGTHCSVDTKYTVAQLNTNAFSPVTKLKENKRILRKVIQFNKSKRDKEDKGLAYRLIRKIKNKLKWS